jgi:hypothetical protein
MDATSYRPNIARHCDATTIVMEDARPRATLLLGLFLALWLVAWGVGEYQVGRALFLGVPYEGPLHLKIGRAQPHGLPQPGSLQPNGNSETWRWFIGWTVGGILAAAVLCLMLISGPYVLTLTRDQLTVSKRIGRLSRNRRWPWSEVLALQTTKLGHDGYTIRLICRGRKTLLLPPGDLNSISSVLEELRGFLARNHLTHVGTIDVPGAPNS